MSHPILTATHKLGQSIWLDYISRELLESGSLEQMVAEGVRGLTSNPTIFEKAISKGTDYDDDIAQGISRGATAAQIFEDLAVCDVARAADTLSGVYDSSGGGDGFVSLEVSPALAHDTEGTVQEARRLWKRVDRPNLMIKVPGTVEGVPAIHALLRDGINVNVTLLFSLEQYRDVLQVFIKALHDRMAKGEDVTGVASVASFFVSRVDTAADQQLRESGHEKLAGRAAIANACQAYRHFLEATDTERWRRLLDQGAQVQRPLWASTSTKDPTYSDIHYVEELLGGSTVNTLPPDTLAAFKDHGKPQPRLLENMRDADQVFAEVTEAGVDLGAITHGLIEDGVQKFAASYNAVVDAIQSKMSTAGAGAS